MKILAKTHPNISLSNINERCMEGSGIWW